MDVQYMVTQIKDNGCSVHGNTNNNNIMTMFKGENLQAQFIHVNVYSQSA